MTKTILRSALLVAAGLLVCFAESPSAAAGTDDAAAVTKPEADATPVTVQKNVRHASRHGKKSAHRSSSKVEEKATTGDKTADAARDGDNARSIPPSVANANAQLTAAQAPSTDTPTGNAAKAMTARANDILRTAPDKLADATPPASAQSDAEVVAADQLNDVDRALRESPGMPSASPVPAASAEAPAAPVTAGGHDSSTWDETSLIGKIFIGFGALLTMASAARMFIG
jgi:hypothetical protein